VKSVLLGESYTEGSERLWPLNAEQLRLRDAIKASDKDSDYESRPCLCGAQDPAQQEAVSLIDRYGLRYRKVLCLECGLLRAEPRWTAKRLGDFYSTAYRQLYNGAMPPERFAEAMLANPWIKGIGQWVRGAQRRLLPAKEKPLIVEIGAGGGWNLAGLPGDWQRVGFDVDEAFLEIGRQQLGLEMRYGLWDEALGAVAKADLVLLSHVVEHLGEPRDSLRKLAQALGEETLVLIEVPGIFKLHWTYRNPMAFMQNVHLYTYCAESLGRLCEECGLELLEVDQTVRLVCRKAKKSPAPASRTSKSLVRRKRAYLRLCEWGFKASQSGFFRGPRTWVMDLYFRALGLLVPRFDRAPRLK
jgi:SAM-dependent methyltransferase